MFLKVTCFDGLLLEGGSELWDLLLTAVLETWRALSPCSWTASQWPEQCNGEADIHYRQRAHANHPH